MAKSSAEIQKNYRERKNNDVNTGNVCQYYKKTSEISNREKRYRQKNGRIRWHKFNTKRKLETVVEDNDIEVQDEQHTGAEKDEHSMFQH